MTVKEATIEGMRAAGVPEEIISMTLQRVQQDFGEPPGMRVLSEQEAKLMIAEVALNYKLLMTLPREKLHELIAKMNKKYGSEVRKN